MRLRIFGFRKIRGICRLAGNNLASSRRTLLHGVIYIYIYIIYMYMVTCITARKVENFKRTPAFIFTYTCIL
jgi:hypothetical protein